MPRWTAVGALLLFPLLSIGQTPDTATLRGRVIDSSRSAIVGVEITVKNALTGFERRTRTDDSGSFALGGLPVAGNYDVTAVKSGFAEAQLNAITLEGGATADVTLRLDVAAGKTQITVTGVVGEVRTDAPQLGDRLGAAQIQETPLLNRKITYLPLLNAAHRPAISQGDAFINQNLFTSNGEGRRPAPFQVYGSSANPSWGRP